MKNFAASVLLLISFNSFGQEQKAELLKEPAGWEFERFALPPQFSPEIRYRGVEELRFAPGMFNKDSANYFTYVFVAQLNNVTEVSQTDINNYLLHYYTGLCLATARDRKLSIDSTQIGVIVQKKKDTPANIYNATVRLFGVFADGAPVKLNLEVKVLSDVAAKKTYLLFIASPRSKGDAPWKQLYEIQRKFVLPG